MNDIFISYAHIDDRPLDHGSKGWISQFHRALELRITQLLGREVTVWRDPKLNGNDFFDDTIVEQFRRASAMVSVISPRYVNSEWCRKEFEEFCQATTTSGGLRIGDKSRVFKVVKTPVEIEELPPRISDLFQSLLGFEFFEIDPDSGRVREFDEMFGAGAKQRYYERIYDLAHEVTQLFKILRKEGPGNGEQVTEATGLTVYLATATSDLREAYDQLRRELLEAGHKVVPDTALAMVAEDFETAARAFLERSDVSIHLVGERFGMVPEGTRESTTQLQNRWAAERCREAPALRRFVWMPTGLQPDDERQAALVTEIQEDPEIHYGAEIVEGSLSVFKKRLTEKLAPKPPPELTRNATGIRSEQALQGSAQVYLICDPRDEENVAALEDYLFEQELEVRTPDFEADEVEFTELHRRHLCECDGVLIYYGQVRKSWVEIKLSDLLKAGGFGRQTPFKANAVYVAPPDDPRKKRFRTHVAELIHQPSEVFAAGPELEKFIERLKERSVAS